jgi:8-oxo-dGTP pyrophosphatase MutT (NUDIX family)
MPAFTLVDRLRAVQLPIAVRRLGYRCAYAVLLCYWFLLHPRVRGVKCVLTRGDDVLLVRHTYGDREWDLPGGTIRRNEPPLDTARREMQEELGVLIQDWRPLGEVYGIAHHRRDELHCFEAEIRDGRVEIDLGELAAMRWFPRAQLPEDVGHYVRRVLERSSG